MQNNKLDRRTFIQKSAKAGIAGSIAVALSANIEAIGGTINPAASPDMVAVKGGEPQTMFRKAIEAWGGMKRTVKPGQTVVVKPNIGWNVVPERAANTNPDLIEVIVRECVAAGAKDVFVVDHTADVWTKCYKNSGIEEATKRAGGKMVPGNFERDYKTVSIPGAKRLKTVKVHELILNSDVLINVPVLKHHVSTKLSLGMKNLMGIVWDRQWWHKNDLHQCIADFASYCKADLTIVDAYRVMKRNGPMGVSTDDVLLQKALMLGTDPLALDTASAKMFGMNPQEVGYIRLCEGLNVGSSDLSKLNIQKIKL
ncbi:MAG: DUF362 domain-containing protein [Carboxylicivirga sp.]|jgi:uncharacterized protein (DUF362 family)|nr:DUF362 domain-containing protein [Carboxylicivirga sp.]